MTIYNGFQQWNGGEWPAILAIGDSWFWYPGNNLLDALARHVALRAEYEHMVLLGQNGAMLAEYVDLPGRPGAYADDLRRLLEPDAMRYFSVVAISGAGNDAVAYGLALRDDCTGAASAADCVDAAGMRALMKSIAQSTSLVLHEVLWAFESQNRAPTVLLHGYDYPVPDERPFDLAGFPVLGPWLGNAMDDRGVPDDLALRTGIMRILIDEVNATFARYASPAAGIHLIDSRGVLDSGAGYRADWANELHPTADGFDKVIDQAWIPRLRPLGMTTH